MLPSRCHGIAWLQVNVHSVCGVTCILLPCRCPCSWDGQSGKSCDLPTEQFCLSHCNGHGACLMGYCKCHEGWYGTDCSRRVAGREGPLESGINPEEQSWLKDYAQLPPAAQEHEQQQEQGQQEEQQEQEEQQQDHSTARRLSSGGSAQQGRPARRRRPYIYVYDMPPAYTTRMLQVGGAGAGAGAGPAARWCPQLAATSSSTVPHMPACCPQAA